MIQMLSHHFGYLRAVQNTYRLPQRDGIPPQGLGHVAIALLPAATKVFCFGYTYTIQLQARICGRPASEILGLARCKVAAQGMGLSGWSRHI
jgi:hypothetical protein